MNFGQAAMGQQGVTGSGMVLVKKGPQRVETSDVSVLREGSTGRVVAMLPRVWAVAETLEAVAGQRSLALVPGGSGAGAGPREAGTPASRPKVEVAFYRKYTQAMLRRYLRMSTEVGRVPSLLGREMFRGNVSSYKVHSFEDVVVFCMDVEGCLARLKPREKEVIRRVGLQEYTQAEAAAVMGLSLRVVVREYGAALDTLTTLLLKAKLLEPLKSCQ